MREAAAREAFFEAAGRPGGITKRDPDSARRGHGAFGRFPDGVIDATGLIHNNEHMLFMRASEGLWMLFTPRNR